MRVNERYHERECEEECAAEWEIARVHDCRSDCKAHRGHANALLPALELICQWTKVVVIARARASFSFHRTDSVAIYKSREAMNTRHANIDM
jgi:hypothetical protein